MTTSEIAKENDIMRALLPATVMGNVFVVTQSVSQLKNLNKIVRSVKNFRDFSPDNDPYQEHNFGAVTVDDVKYFWKIDYYDCNLQYGVDPYEEKARRVLTIMRADEY